MNATRSLSLFIAGGVDGVYGRHVLRLALTNGGWQFRDWTLLAAGLEDTPNQQQHAWHRIRLYAWGPAHRKGTYSRGPA
jgi:hypothetical protein